MKITKHIIKKYDFEDLKEYAKVESEKTVIETLEQEIEICNCEIRICNREIRKSEDELLRVTERKAHYNDRKIMLRDLLKKAQEEAKKVSALKDKHFNECAQIMRYSDVSEQVEIDCPEN